MPKENKSTNIEVEKRVNALVPLISILNRHELSEYVQNETDWGIAENQIYEYVKKAKEIIKEQFKESNKDAVENSYNNLVNLYKQAFQEKDFRTCLAIQKEINEVYGIKIQKIDHTSNGKGIILNITTSDE